MASSFPSQVLQEADGRVGVSFWNATPSEAAVTLRAVPVREIGATPGGRDPGFIFSMFFVPGDSTIAPVQYRSGIWAVPDSAYQPNTGLDRYIRTARDTFNADASARFGAPKRYPNCEFFAQADAAQAIFSVRQTYATRTAEAHRANWTLKDTQWVPSDARRLDPVNPSAPRSAP